MNVRVDYRGEGWFESKQGRFVGIMTPEQFAALKKDPKDLARRVSSIATADLSKVKTPDIIGKRLVVDVAEGADHDLFVSAEIKEVKSVMTSTHAGYGLNLVDVDEAEIIIKEKKEL